MPILMNNLGETKIFKIKGKYLWNAQIKLEILEIKYQD